jgi:hypothetical protein
MLGSIKIGLDIVGGSKVKLDELSVNSELDSSEDEEQSLLVLVDNPISSPISPHFLRFRLYGKFVNYLSRKGDYMYI